MTTRRAWRIRKAGNIGDLRLVEEPLPPLEPGKVRVATRAVGLNFADVFALLGLYSATPAGAFVPGLEACGAVVGVGRGITSWRGGEDVIVLTRFGGYATHIDVDPRYCVALPQGWTHAEGSAYLVQALTALYALETLGAVEPGHHVLVHSAAGGVGLFALALCKAIGARAIGTVGSEAKRAFLEARGYRDVIVRRGPLRGSVDSLLQGAPLHLVLDAVGGDVFRESYELLAPTGRLVTFGAASFTPPGRRVRYLAAAWRYLRRPRLDPLAMISDNKGVLGFNLIWLWERVELLPPMVARLQSLAVERPHVGRSFAFADAHEAIAHLQSGASVGKVVLTLPAPDA